MTTECKVKPSPPLNTATSHLALICFNHNFPVRRYSKSHVALWDVIGKPEIVRQDSIKITLWIIDPLLSGDSVNSDRFWAAAW
jgi:hypothetical protein